MGYDLFPEPSIASRERGIRPLLHWISLVGPLYRVSGKIRTHYVPARRRKKTTEFRGNRGHHNVPELGAHAVGKSSLERGWILYGKARKRVRQFSRDRGRPVIGITHTCRFPLNLRKGGRSGV